MAILTAAELVAKPTPSQPLRYGLLQAAVGPLDLPTHSIQGGLKYVHAMCGPGFGYEIECIDDQASKADSFEAGTETVLGAPFVVYATVTCPPVGFTDEEKTALAVQRLHSVEQSIVEEVFSSSTFGQSPGLANNPAVVTVTGAGDTAVNVVSELERALYCTTGYGPAGYLHMAIPVFNQLKFDHLIEFDGTRWRTPSGTVVSSGCYANLEPDGDTPADGVFWIYATGQTTVWRTPDSDLIISPVEGALDRSANQVLMLVERPYVVTFECAVYAKAVTLWT